MAGNWPDERSETVTICQLGSVWSAALHKNAGKLWASCRHYSKSTPTVRCNRRDGSRLQASCVIVALRLRASGLPCVHAVQRLGRFPSPCRATRGFERTRHEEHGDEPSRRIGGLGKGPSDKSGHVSGAYFRSNEWYIGVKYIVVSHTTNAYSICYKRSYFHSL